MLFCNGGICDIVVFIISSSINVTIIIMRCPGTGSRELSASALASTARKAQRAGPPRMRFTTLRSSDCDVNIGVLLRLQAAVHRVGYSRRDMGQNRIFN